MRKSQFMCQILEAYIAENTQAPSNSLLDSIADLAGVLDGPADLSSNPDHMESFMANDSMPFVAIIGGFGNLDAAQVDDAKKTAQEIGAALATAGMGLVVYFSNDQSLEPHVVSGYVNALPQSTSAGSIRVRFAEPQRHEVRFAEQATHPELFEISLFPGDDWEAPFYRSLVSTEGVDAVLLMAGARATLIAGQIAVARALPVLAIDKFPGSAKVIRRELASQSGDYPAAGIHTVSESVSWLKEECQKRTKHREEARRNEEKAHQKELKYLKIISQRNRTIWAACAFAALLVIVFLGVSRKPNPDFYPALMFAALIAAGATGTLVRSVIWELEETASITSLFLGAVAGFVVGLAYLIPQWVGFPGPMAPSAEEGVTAYDKIQFVSVTLVAISAGVGFDTVFARLKKQSEDQPIGPPT